MNKHETMNKPEAIKDLEEELNTTFEEVKEKDIMELRLKTTAIFSLDNNGNVTGIHIENFGLKSSPLNLNHSEVCDNLLYLNLFANQITDISTIENLTNLIWIDLNDNQIADMSSLKDLKYLQVLYLNTNQLRNISEIQNLISLTKLHLNDNKLINLDPLRNLKRIKELNLDNNKLSNISSLQGLINLENLTLSRNNLKNISPLKNLYKLIKLDLSSNQITDLSPLQGLTGLTHLDLDFNKITELSPVHALTGLSYLNLIANQITDLSPVHDLTGLTHLNLIANQITDLSPMHALTGLKLLNLDGNQITDLSPLHGLTQLTVLGLAKNNLKRFPEFLLDFPQLELLTLYGNPIEDIEQELLEKGFSANCLSNVTDYYRLLDQEGYEYNRQLKVLLLGNGRVGKTCVVNSLFGEPCRENEASTHGVVQRRLHVPEGTYPPMDLQFWDFGGQDIYHGTHRLFMQHKTLYLVVWDTETEQQPYHEDNLGDQYPNFPINYWLDYIHSQSPESPVILLRNKADDGERHVVPHQYHKLKEDYKNLRAYFDYSAMKPTRKDELLELIQSHIYAMPQFGRKIPKPWYRIREKLQEMAQTQKMISYSTYYHLCVEENIHQISATSEQSLLDYLHATGVVYYDKDLFDGHIILDQKWAIEGINTLFERTTVKPRIENETGGIFSLKDLHELAWKDAGLSAEEEKLYIDFMQSCDICFPLDKENPEDTQYYVAPQFLSPLDNYSREKLRKEKQEGVYFIFDYYYFHIGIFHSFMARIARRIPNKGQGQFTNNVIRLSNKDFTAEAIVEYEETPKTDKPYAGRIIINISGEKRRELLFDLLEEFKPLNENRKVTEVVSLDMENTVTLERLKTWKEKGLESNLSREDNLIQLADYEEFLTSPKQSYSEKAQEAQTEGTEKAQDLVAKDIRHQKPESEGHTIFIAYSSKNKKLKEAFEHYLKDYLQSAGYTYELWSDKEIAPGDDWNKAIEDSLQVADIGVLLVSPRIFSSRYIMSNELKAMLEKRENGFVLFPVLLQQSRLEHFPELRAIQFFKTKKEEYGITETSRKNESMAFDELLQLEDPYETHINNYFLKLTEHIDDAVSRL